MLFKWANLEFQCLISYLLLNHLYTTTEQKCEPYLITSLLFRSMQVFNTICIATTAVGIDLAFSVCVHCWCIDKPILSCVTKTLKVPPKPIWQVQGHKRIDLWPQSLLLLIYCWTSLIRSNWNHKNSKHSVYWLMFIHILLTFADIQALFNHKMSSLEKC